LKEFLERHVSVCVSLRNARDSFQEISAKARESILHGCRKRTNPHRERFAKEMAKEKSEKTILSGFWQQLKWYVKDLNDGHMMKHVYNA